MTRITTGAAAALGALLCLLAASGAPARAQSNGLDAFVGTYVGVAEVLGPDGGVEERRDMDIVLSPLDRGFRIVWTNVTLVDGRRDVPGVTRRVEEVAFMPGGDGLFVEERRGSLFRTRSSMDPMGGDPVRWARIDGDRLGVFSLVLLEDGRYELQAYERVLTEHGLDIDFRRIVDGRVERRIEGRTVRVE